MQILPNELLLSFCIHFGNFLFFCFHIIVFHIMCLLSKRFHFCVGKKCIKYYYIIMGLIKGKSSFCNFTTEY